MATPFGPVRLIVNPRAGRGASAALAPDLVAALRREGVEADAVTTQAPGHAVALASEALDADRRHLCAVGGDGTVHEVVNGMFDGQEPRHPEAVLALAQTGSGGDFARTVGMSRLSPQALARRMATDQVMPVDVGTVACRDADGQEATRLWINVAEVGWGAEVVRRAPRWPRRFGRFRYLLAAYGAIAATRRPPATITLDHTTVERPLVAAVIGNGQFFGGGMKVCPRALPDDGRFNVQIFWGSRSQVFSLTTRIYRGEHVPHPNIVEQQSATVAVDADEALAVEADGEPLGTTPARFGLLPRALRLKL